MSDLSRQAALSRSSVNRYVVTLVELGYVFRDERTNKYRPTSKTLELSRGVTRDQKIRGIVLPSMRQTCRAVGWPMNLSTIKNAHIILIAHTDDISPLASKERGTMLMRPVLGRAAGHVLLANLPKPVAADILSIALQHNPRLYSEINLDPKDIPEHLKVVLQKGYDVFRTVNTRLITVAVPVYIKDAVPFALSASANASVMSITTAVKRFLAPLRECADNITKSLLTTDTDRWLDNNLDTNTVHPAPSKPV
jgi:DNA-binding IclR family transcriptional regulator